MHICSMHIDVLFASEQSSWQVVSRHSPRLFHYWWNWRPHHLQHFNRRCLSCSFWDIYGTLWTCLSADPLPSRKKQKSTIACTCLSRTINSAKWTNSSTLQRILTGSSNPDWKLESAWKVQDCEATPEFPLNQSTRHSFGHLSDSLRQGNLWRGTQSLRMPRISVIYKKWHQRQFLVQKCSRIYRKSL